MRPVSRWRIVLDAVLAAALVYGCCLGLADAMDHAESNEEIRVAIVEAQLLYAAFDRYFERNREFPATHSRPRFDPETFDPLRRRGYYRGTLTARLLMGRVDAYDSPDDNGLNREFWLEMTLATDPSIRLLVARSDDAPLCGGRWCDGVFVLRNGVLEPV